MVVTTPDEAWMTRALELAERGRGAVEPNPLVGAVVVREGQLVGEGWHEKFGQPHAEVYALAQAGEAARGATLYVTLEPCCHHGKTPPCTDAVLRAGIARVVAALEDPFPQVAGRGAALLRQAGVAVDMGVCAVEARRQNAPYLTLLTLGRPYVHAKWAMTLDGRIATRTGDSQWISNDAARRRAHVLRGKMDAILIGIGTARADDPLLTPRPAGPRSPCRVVLDSRARLPIGSRLVQTARDVPTLVATVADNTDNLTAAGCEVLRLPADADGRPDIGALLQEMGRRRWTNLLVEGGAEVLGSFLDCGAIDEVHVFIAPRLIGGAQAKGPMGGLGFATLSQSLLLSNIEVETIDRNVYVHSWRSA